MVENNITVVSKYSKLARKKQNMSRGFTETNDVDRNENLGPIAKKTGKRKTTGEKVKN